jgi:hypothetical protein
MKSMHFVMLSLLVFTSAACSVVSPPPLVARHVTARSGPVGSTDFAVVGGVGGGIWIDGALGGAAQVRHQIAPDLAVGLDIGGGIRTDGDSKCTNDSDGCTDNPPDWLGSGRMYVLYNPNNYQWVRIIMGVGGGAMDTGNRHLTTDLGVVFSHTFWRIFTPYISPIVAISLPLYPGAAIDDGLKPTTTGYYGLNLGVKVHLHKQFSISTEWTSLAGHSTGGEECFFSGLTGGLGVTF